ncbi:hypothetical protein KRM28CT15_69190 [Krasilnikovia sp. M28-CT-15]
MRRWSSLAVAIATFALLAASFLPWFRSGWAQSSDGVDTYESTLVDAWSASAWWSWGIALGLVAGAGMTATLLVPMRTTTSRRWCWVFPALALAGLALIVWRRMTIPTASLAGGGSWEVAGQTDFGEVVRDHLAIYHAPGRDLDVCWGFPVGAAVLLTLFLALVVAALPGGGHRFPWAGDSNPEPTD